MGTILITGASGFIGSFAVAEASKRGYTTYAGLRKSSNADYLKGISYQFFETTDVGVEALTKQLLIIKQNHGNLDYIIHCAGVTKCNNVSDFDQVNVGLTKNLIEAIHRANISPKQFVFISSLAACGSGNEQTYDPIHIEDTPKPITLYGKSKLLAEEAIKKSGIPYIILRPTGVYGPKEKDYFIFIQTVKRFNLAPAMGFEPQRLTFVYVDDLVRLMFDTLESSHHNKTYLVTDGNVYTDKEYSDLVKKTLGKKYILNLRVPLFLVKFISSFLPVVCGWLGYTPTLNKDKYKIMRCKNWICDINPIEKDFNFVAKYDLERGLKESVNWYKSEGWL
ncbi:MAG: NAD(P)-dependent oxidoreductase [Prevotellaceae bacterium]|jgi:nucleoside-diphosphate-sugar epimerase|nr:NAD(P)-dependent oxidoreductase [Prevotellaceae bacterium]